MTIAGQRWIFASAGMTQGAEAGRVRELSLHILDVLENALEAGATRVELSIVEDLEMDRLTIDVQDNGRGMDAETAQRALDPFFTTRTTRHVGLGLPLFAAAARQCDGDLTLESVPGQGTRIRASFRHNHLDRAPLGNLTDTLLAFLLSERGETELCYCHQLNGREFQFDTAAIQAELGEVPLSHPMAREWLYEYIAEGEAELRRAD
jgi:anti-sigma regulatory factor (Ser/Thr protein kinase)